MLAQVCVLLWSGYSFGKLAVLKVKTLRSYYSGVLVSGKSLDCKLSSFGLIWVASPPNTPLLILAKSTIH
jgi:hypothetical protein